MLRFANISTAATTSAVFATTAFVAFLLTALTASPPAHAEISRCIAMAEAPRQGPSAMRLVRVALPAYGPVLPTPWRGSGADIRRVAATREVATTDEKVTLHYLTHATFRITTPQGIIAVTDYAGFFGGGRAPDVATMNHAHSTHYTDFPDPAIKHVLRGWNPEGGPAKHALRVGDVFIRNVPTDIRRWGGGIREADGNSIFIFEVAGLCIGHLGHLHHELAPEDLARIGQLDVVLAPVDGSYTLDHAAMVKTLKVLKARMIIPMHAFGPQTLAAFLQRMGAEFPVEYKDSSTLEVSVDDLPDQATIIVLPEASSATGWGWD